MLKPEMVIMKMDKKGETESGSYDIARKSIFWVVFGVIITIIVLVYAFTVAGLQAKLVYLPEKLKAEAISQRFVNIPECFAYQDSDTGRVYPGVVDLVKFDNKTMSRCYHTESEKGYEDYNFRLVLKKQGAEVITNNYFYGDEFTLFREVLVKKGDELIPDTLYIYVQAKIFTNKVLEKQP